MAKKKKPPSYRNAVYSLLFALAAIAAALFFFPSFQAEMDFAAKATETKATVIKVDRVDSSFPDQDSPFNYRATMEYLVNDRTYTLKHTYFLKTSPGKKKTIRYLTKNPRNARAKDNLAWYYLILLAIPLMLWEAGRDGWKVYKKKKAIN